MADGPSILIVTVLLAISLTARDLLVGKEQPKAQTESKSKNMDVKVPSSGPVGPNIKFQICFGWGYKKVFEEYANAIRQRYPQISVHGANYPPGAGKQMLATVLSTLKWVSLGVIVFGEKVNIWATLGLSPPSPYTWAQQNKIVSCIGLFFLSNAVENMLVQTGAFEVELNGMPIWSKLKTGRVPQGNELLEIIENQMQLSKNEFKGKYKGATTPDYKVTPGEINFDKKDFADNKEVATEDVTEEEEDEVDDDSNNDNDNYKETSEDKSTTKEKYEDEFSEIDRETSDL